MICQMFTVIILLNLPEAEPDQTAEYLMENYIYHKNKKHTAPDWKCCDVRRIWWFVRLWSLKGNMKCQCEDNLSLNQGIKQLSQSILETG